MDSYEVKASPAARKLARELGVDITKIIAQASIIQTSDVISYASKASGASPTERPSQPQNQASVVSSAWASLSSAESARRRAYNPASFWQKAQSANRASEDTGGAYLSEEDVEIIETGAIEERAAGDGYIPSRAADGKSDDEILDKLADYEPAGAEAPAEEKPIKQLRPEEVFPFLDAKPPRSPSKPTSTGPIATLNGNAAAPKPAFNTVWSEDTPYDASFEELEETVPFPFVDGSLSFSEAKDAGNGIAAADEAEDGLFDYGYVADETSFESMLDDVEEKSRASAARGADIYEIFDTSPIETAEAAQRDAQSKAQQSSESKTETPPQVEHAKAEAPKAAPKPKTAPITGAIEIPAPKRGGQNAPKEEPPEEAEPAPAASWPEPLEEDAPSVWPPLTEDYESLSPYGAQSYFSADVPFGEYTLAGDEAEVGAEPADNIIEFPFPSLGFAFEPAPPAHYEDAANEPPAAQAASAPIAEGESYTATAPQISSSIYVSDVPLMKLLSKLGLDFRSGIIMAVCKAAAYSFSRAGKPQAGAYAVINAQDGFAQYVVDGAASRPLTQLALRGAGPEDEAAMPALTVWDLTASGLHNFRASHLGGIMLFVHHAQEVLHIEMEAETESLGVYEAIRFMESLSECLQKPQSYL